MSENICIQCGQPASLKCSACHLVSYCTKEHQKKHWKTHKSICKPYEIQYSEVLGKHLIASRDLAAGDTIFTELPLITGPKTHTDYPVVSIPCVGCYRQIPVEDPPGRCLGCGWPSCATHCPGLKDPRGHGTECPVLKLRNSFAVSKIDDFYRHNALTPLRCLLLQKRDPKKWKQLLEMQSHEEHRGPTTDIYAIIDENVVQYLYEHYVCPLKAFESQANVKIIADCAKKTIHKVCGILDVNALEIRLNNGYEISAVYPTAYLVEHNCVPNTRHTFDTSSEDPAQQYRIVVKAACPIKKGEHISTMYSHALWGTQARRDHLRDTKYFSCTCERCRDPTELGTYISGLRCMGTPEVPCSGTQLPVNPLDDDTEWACDTCAVKLANAEVMFLVAQIGDEVETLQAEGPTVKQLEVLLEKLLTFLHPHHYHLYSTKHSLVQLYGYQQGYLPNQLTDDMLKRKAAMCRELVEISDKIDPGNSRLSLYQGVSLHELHSAQIELIKRKWTECFDREPYRVQIRECRTLLARAIAMLENEMEGSAGWRLRELIESSQKNLERWIDRLRVAV